MSIKMLKNVAGILAITALFGTTLKGQDRNDVIKSFNDGAKAQQTDVKAAIAAFENVITLSDKVGETAADLKQKAVQVLPGLYAKLASNAITEKKPAAEVIKLAKDAVKAADKYPSANGKEGASQVLVKGYYALGIEYFSKKDYDHALQSFDSLLAINPNFNSAIFNKALIFSAQSNSASFEQTIDTYIDRMKTARDSAKVKQASSKALEYFRAQGSKANQANKLDEALDLLNKASKYGTDKDVFYFFSDVYNKKKNFNDGAVNAQKGLDLETGAPEAKAKFYFQLGLAQAGKGQTAEACATFKNAMFGPFAEPAKAERKNLKCQ
jgi:tetratricopeptide (TPR) repeat protein